MSKVEKITYRVTYEKLMEDIGAFSVAPTKAGPLKVPKDALVVTNLGRMVTLGLCEDKKKQCDVKVQCGPFPRSVQVTYNPTDLAGYNEYPSLHTAPTGGDGKVLFIDVGAGSAAVVQCGGKTVLIDAGDKFSAEALQPGGQSAGWAFQAFNISSLKLDAVIITHGDADHWEGLKGLPATAFNTSETWLIAGNPAKDKARQAWKDYMRTFTNRVVLEAVDTEDPVNVNSKCYDCLPSCMKVYAPPIATENDSNANQRSLIVEIEMTHSADTIRTIIPGDAMQKEMIALRENKAKFLKKCDILAAPHHGSDEEETASLAFYHKMAAKYVIFSMGSDFETTMPGLQILEFLKLNHPETAILMTHPKSEKQSRKDLVDSGHILFEIAAGKITSVTTYLAKQKVVVNPVDYAASKFDVADAAMAARIYRKTPRWDVYDVPEEAKLPDGMSRPEPVRDKMVLTP